MYQSVSLPVYTLCCINDLLMDCFFKEENYVRVWSLVRSFGSICLSYHVNQLNLQFFASLTFNLLNASKSLSVDLTQSKLPFLKILSMHVVLTVNWNDDFRAAVTLVPKAIFHHYNMRTNLTLTYFINLGKLTCGHGRFTGLMMHWKGSVCVHVLITILVIEVDSFVTSTFSWLLQKYYLNKYNVVIIIFQFAVSNVDHFNVIRLKVNYCKTLWFTAL